MTPFRICFFFTLRIPPPQHPIHIVVSNVSPYSAELVFAVAEREEIIPTVEQLLVDYKLPFCVMWSAFLFLFLLLFLFISS